MSLIDTILLIVISFQLYKLSHFLIIKDEQELDFGTPIHRGRIDYSDRLIDQLHRDGWIEKERVKNGKH